MKGKGRGRKTLNSNKDTPIPSSSKDTPIPSSSNFNLQRPKRRRVQVIIILFIVLFIEILTNIFIIYYLFIY